jgi:cytochrome b561
MNAAEVSPDGRYTTVAAVIHWLTVLAIFVLIGVGWKMVSISAEMENPLKMRLYDFHKSLGLTVLLLTAIRIAWRLAHKPPPLPAHMTPIERLAAHLSHLGFYGFLIVLPLSGWIFTDSVGFAAPFWGIEMPAIYVWDPETRTATLFGLLPLRGLFADGVQAWKAMQATHRLLGYAMMALIVVHIAAALKHTFVDKDGLLLRMVPRFGRK